MGLEPLDSLILTVYGILEQLSTLGDVLANAKAMLSALVDGNLGRDVGLGLEQRFELVDAFDVKHHVLVADGHAIRSGDGFDVRWQ